MATVNILCRVYNLFATDIMRKDLTFVSYESSYGELQLLLETSSHASYPLVDTPSNYTHPCFFKSLSRELVWHTKHEAQPQCYFLY